MTRLMPKQNEIDWLTLIQTVGLPMVLTIFSRWSSGTPPTPEDYAALEAALAQRGKDRAIKKLTEMGIDIDSDQGKAFLALFS